MTNALRGAVTSIGRWQGLDRLAESRQKAIATAFAKGGRTGRRIQNALNGVWLGHPLHPVLTDLPIGFWTSALLLDLGDALGGRRELRAGADLALGAGVGSALATAATGLADWQFTTGEARRIGLIHALLNGSGVVLSALSLILRRRGSRGAGRCLSFSGYALASLASYLGGHLVYEDRIGVNHASRLTAPAEFTPVLADGDLAEGRPQRVDAAGMPVVLVRQGGRIYALADTCAHLGGPLAEGTLAGGSIICPWHGSRFALADGRVLDGPSTFRQPLLESRVSDGRIEVRAAAGR